MDQFTDDSGSKLDEGTPVEVCVNGEWGTVCDSGSIEEKLTLTIVNN